ncbi:related to Ribosome biogenesis protein NSA1 [Saccharomycodes ludwigii]|uniref:Ribosome biogenesis protein NSA1 n=1 Tax=Saccharomycodes ludwigii TaxID=36035 RepID=A0A376B898_9ASCO|nr:hypothetical protein SCDLUD_001018 [Saccharomycodes ludwigii]KAH3903385.1 hypothetical protein SCDLUD_001018 [Saccharomycodes ludwigii]SSD60887.1 related to Ribosome biogenesis protein NSA1 [Saccharomycodes ludwigii]
MRLLASCEDGSLKEIVFNHNTNTSIIDGIKPFHLSIIRKNKIRISKILTVSENLLFVCMNDGSVELLRYEYIDKTQPRDTSDEQKPNNENLKKKENKDKKTVQPEPVPFKIIRINENKLDDISGMFDESKLEKLNQKSSKRSKMHDEFVSVSILPDSVITLGTKSGLIHFIKIDTKLGKLEFIKTHELTAPMDFLQFNDLSLPEHKEEKSGFVFAYGGEENIIKLIKVSKNFLTWEKIWEAKNVKNDNLDLRVPVWPISVIFTSVQKNVVEDASKLNFSFIETTKLGFVRHYETQHGRKPVCNLDIIPARPSQRQLWPSIIKSLFSTRNKTVNGNSVESFGNIQSDEYLFLCDSVKNVYRIDPKNAQVKGKYGNSDIYGITTSLNLYEEKKNCFRYLVCGGIDGYVRIFDVENRQLRAKIYVGSKVLDCVLLDASDIETEEEKKKKKKTKKRVLTEYEEERENDKLWNDLGGEALSKSNGKKFKKIVK